MPNQKQKFCQKTEQFFNDVKKNTENFFKAIKKNIQNTKKKISITLKEKQLKWLKRETKNWMAHPRTLAVKKLVEKDIKNVKSDTSQIKDDTAQIKKDTSQILLNNAQIISLLEIINYKAENIETILTPIIPNLESIIDKVDNLENYLKERLGSKWKRLKKDWKKYKEGKISKKTFILSGFKSIGKSFVSVFARSTI